MFNLAAFILLSALLSPTLGRIEYVTYQTPIREISRPGSDIKVCYDGYEAKKCDGKVECPDGADEDRDICYDNICKRDEFKCAYGGCLPKRKVCNGRMDCVDGSDEMLPHCPKATRGFVCDNGQRIHSWEVCDGRPTCLDKSDETQELCANGSCHSNQTQCMYGACLYDGASCDGVADCVDGSDETAMFCSENQCKRDEFRCAYGACVSETKLCGSTRACADGSDHQTYCQSEYIERGFFYCPNEDRATRAWKVCDGERDCPNGSDETEHLCANATCHSKQFKCKYGACLHNGSSCDGTVHCFDGSDETEETCMSKKCEADQFRCSYGACIPKEDVCDGKRHCADGSDENHLVCQNNHCTNSLQFQCGYGPCLKRKPCYINENIRVADDYCNEDRITATSFKCEDGVRILPQKMCDGVNDCTDKSDEDPVICRNLHRYGCRNDTCTYLFSQFACDGNQDCADGSDESLGMCENIRCIVPPPLEHGHYYGLKSLSPGYKVKTLTLKVICDEGYTVDGPDDDLICNEGYWSVEPMPKCVRYCTLESDPRIAYRCADAGAAPEQSRACRSRELAGARAMPACRAPAHHPAHALPHITCVDGAWDSTPNCTTECGLVTLKGTPLVSRGRPAERGELPWNAGVYQKINGSFSHICGGSLVSRNVIISAAHCFWDFNITESKQMQLSEDNYAVAVGNLHQRWKHPDDRDAQWSMISKIILPKDYEGFTRNQQADLAVVTVANAFEFRPHIRPVCLDFDESSDEMQLKVGRKGKVAGWGLTTAHGVVSEKLNTVELPYVDMDECNNRFPSEFKGFLTLDKFCVGYLNRGIALCRGDSGSGLAFPETYNGEERYFLRGITSTAPKNSANFDECNVNIYTAMTNITKHKDFIKQNL